MNTFDLSKDDRVKLNTCVFCGSGDLHEFTLANVHDDYGCIRCDSCQSQGPLVDLVGGYWKAHAAWNRRHDETPSEFERLCGKENSHV